MIAQSYLPCMTRYTQTLKIAKRNKKCCLIKQITNSACLFKKGSKTKISKNMFAMRTGLKLPPVVNTRMQTMERWNKKLSSWKTNNSCRVL